MLRNLEPAANDIPFEGDLEDWLIRLAVYSPMDEDRKRDLDRWRNASAEAHAAAFCGLLMTLEAMKGSIHPKRPLEVRFPVPYRPQRTIPNES